MHTKPILFVSPLPPPHGGIATWTKTMIDIGLPNEFSMILIDTKIRGQRHIFDHVIFSLSELSRTTRIIGSLLFHLLTKKPKLMHLNCSLSSVGVFRDLACAWLAKLFHVPVINHYHGNLPDFNSRRFYGLSKIGLQGLMKMAVINIVENNPSLKEAKTLQKNNHAHLVLLPNFIEDNIFNYQVQMKNIDNRPRALFAGGITRAKGCADILAIAKQMPNIDFYLFGKMHQDMTALFVDYPANIILHDVVDHDLLLNEMCASDFLLFPSYTEGFPLTVLEAMAIGMPVIATDVGAIPEMIDEGLGGFLVKPQDVLGFIHAINKIISDPILKVTMGKYNKQKSFNHYRHSIVMSKLLTIYHQLTG